MSKLSVKYFLEDVITEERLQKLLDYLEVDPEDLQNDYVKYPGRVAYANAIADRLKFRIEGLEDVLKQQKALAFTELREQKGLSQKDAEIRVYTYPAVIKTYKKLRRLRKVYATLNGIRLGINEKRDMLVGLGADRRREQESDIRVREPVSRK